MAFPASPVFPRRPRPIDPFSIDDDEVDDDDQISVISQSPYFVTQPTQIVERSAIKPRPATLHSSSPSKIEVPASSPFKPQSAQRNGGRLANLMAPAGTSFKPPARQAAPVPKTGVKRDFIMISDDELDTPIYAGGDSSDDNKPARGDIKPSSFRRKESGSIGSTAQNHVSGKRKQNPLKYANVGSPITSPTKPYAPEKNLVTISTLSSSQSSLESFPPILVAKPARRRLVQGRRNRSPSNSPVKVKRPSAPPSQAVIEILSDDSGDDDRDDDFKNTKASPEPSSPTKGRFEDYEFEERVLQYLNTCDTVQLMAIANIKEESAKLMVARQPFADLQDATRVSMSQKKNRKKSAKVSIGEEVVSAVKSYARALDGIDHVIEVCEAQADSIKSTTSTWNIDITGHPRADTRTGGSFTPTSIEESPKLVDLPLKQPKRMKGHCTMKPFQVYGLNWLYLLYERQYGGILADDMGLGKTCQIISLMCSIIEDWESQDNEELTRPWPNLIFVPPSTLANWKAEFKRFAPSVNVTVYQGSQAVRDEIAYDILEDPTEHHVVLTSYTQISRQEDISNLRRLKPMAAIFDEGHKMKNPKTKLYKDLIRITASWRLILSGTPVQNNLMEMIALLQFVEPELFRDHFEDLEALFNQKASLVAVSQGALLHSERVARARTILEPFILQRRKEQVLKDLPPKTARVEYCAMDGTQKAIYCDYERRFKKVDLAESVAQSKAGRENDNNNVWIQLRKSAIHPQLFRRYFSDKDVEAMAKLLMKKVPQSELRQPKIEHLVNEIKALSDFEIHLWCRDYKCIEKYDIPDGSWMECTKVRTLLALIRQYQKNGDRALVFTRFAKVIEILGESLASEGIRYLSLQGNTDVSERQELINEFNEDDSIPVFLLTTGSGGTGINLTAANKVIIFDQSDNPQDDLQAENRAHRLGQTRPVEVVRLISKDTIEELVYKACQKKLELANKVTGWSTAEMSASEMETAVREQMKNHAAETPPSES
ncbi:SNF2 family N-terminal domain-containing protein [Lasiosphaeria ovina]|uniref:SNF2 family N-terminal domain-containing protein n=1 Tax=Lasiosphaeria ovina TaxID=92902 RepID=A0AAE0NKE8_9PEZI|nr:SNF2 family N-terminal domain-containing protein [Lasiosphaeria ovina]